MAKTRTKRTTGTMSPMSRQSLSEGIRRNNADGIIEAVEEGGRITLPTLVRLLTLLDEKTDYKHHIEIGVETGALLKTIDNERDALETVRRLETAPPKGEDLRLIWHYMPSPGVAGCGADYANMAKTANRNNVTCGSCLKIGARPVKIGDRIRSRRWSKMEWPDGHEVIAVTKKGISRVPSELIPVKEIGRWIHADGAAIEWPTEAGTDGQ
jgi:hypothetical protein